MKAVGYIRVSSEEQAQPASACLECGECEPKCPQKIPIMAQLKEVARTLGK
jgi:uncharacterized protein